MKLTDRGFIQVNPATLETTAEGVYSIGDVAGPPMLAHKGEREGVDVAELLAGHPPRPIDYTNVPSVTYCHPEVASRGAHRGAGQGQRKLRYRWAGFPSAPTAARAPRTRPRAS